MYPMSWAELSSSPPPSLVDCTMSVVLASYTKKEMEGQQKAHGHSTLPGSLHVVDDAGPLLFMTARR